MKRKAAVVFALLIIGAVVWILAAAFGTDPHSVPFMMVGKPAPLFKIKRLDKEGVVNLADYKGRPVVLNFWATWCSPCKAEQPILDDASLRHPEVTFIGIVFEDEEAATRQYLKDTGTPYIHVFDRKSTVAVDFGVSGVPETYFINKEGVIVKKSITPFSHPDQFDAELQEILK